MIEELSSDHVKDFQLFIANLKSMLTSRGNAVQIYSEAHFCVSVSKGKNSFKK